MVKQQKFRERRYPIKSFTVPSNKVSTQQYYIQWEPHLPSPLKLHPLLVTCIATPQMTSKRPPPLLLQIPEIWQTWQGTIHSLLLPLVPQREPQGSPHFALPRWTLLGMMVWSLIPRAGQPLDKFASQNLSLLPWKTLRKRSLYGGHYTLAPLENNVGVYAPSIFAQNCRLKLVKILNLAKKILYDRIDQWVDALHKTCNFVIWITP